MASGILQLAKSEFDKASKDPSYRIRYRFFDASDGLADFPVRLGTPAAIRGGDGRLWFTTMKGVAVIDPARLNNIATKPPVKITRVLANHQPLASRFGVNPVLSPRTSVLQIDYTAVSLSAASQLHFRYMLEGLDTDWVNAGTRRQAFYTNLSPKSYRFRVRASLAGGPESESEWAFVVQPAMYQTRSFYVIILIGIVAAIAIGWWQRMRTLRKQFALVLSERARIGREIHDTVLQNFAGTALQLEGIAKQADISPSATKAALRHLRRQIEQYMEEARDSIMDLRSPETHRVLLGSALREWMDARCHQTDGSLKLLVTGAAQRYHAAVETQILRIAQEAIRNAIQHSEARQILVEINYEPENVRLFVQDDGKGFSVLSDPGGEANGWGLVGMRERATRLGGQLSIISQPGKGTLIELIVRNPVAIRIS
jgi:signal transduction histidine kinase